MVDCRDTAAGHGVAWPASHAAMSQWGPTRGVQRSAVEAAFQCRRRPPAQLPPSSAAAGVCSKPAAGPAAAAAAGATWAGGRQGGRQRAGWRYRCMRGPQDSRTAAAWCPPAGAGPCAPLPSAATSDKLPPVRIPVRPRSVEPTSQTGGSVRGPGPGPGPGHEFVRCMATPCLSTWCGQLGGCGRVSCKGVDGGGQQVGGQVGNGQGKPEANSGGAV